jgi:hypothetical protein
MIIDCETCEVRDLACGDCVVPVLLGAPTETTSTDALEIDDGERRALDVLAAAGMVPRLQLTLRRKRAS